MKSSRVTQVRAGRSAALDLRTLTLTGMGFGSVQGANCAVTGFH